MAFSSKYSGAGGDDDDVAQQEMKAKLKSAWGSAAENYVWNIQDPCSSSSPKVTMGMSVGYKLVARSVVSLSDKELGAPVVLDVASAGGEPAITIAKVIPGATVHATDIAPPMMDLIRRRAAEAGVSNVTASVADGEALTGFGDGSVDAVTCTWGLIFMPNWRKAIQHSAAALPADIRDCTLYEFGHSQRHDLSSREGPRRSRGSRAKDSRPSGQDDHTIITAGSTTRRTFHAFYFSHMVA